MRNRLLSIRKVIVIKVYCYGMDFVISVILFTWVRLKDVISHQKNVIQFDWYIKNVQKGETPCFLFFFKRLIASSHHNHTSTDSSYQSWKLWWMLMTEPSLNIRILVDAHLRWLITCFIINDRPRLVSMSWSRLYNQSPRGTRFAESAGFRNSEPLHPHVQHHATPQDQLAIQLFLPSRCSGRRAFRQSAQFKAASEKKTWDCVIACSARRVPTEPGTFCPAHVTDESKRKLFKHAHTPGWPFLLLPGSEKEAKAAAFH